MLVTKQAVSARFCMQVALKVPLACKTLLTPPALSQRQSSALMGLVVKVISTVKKQKAEFMESTKPLLWYKLGTQKHVASWTKY